MKKFVVALMLLSGLAYLTAQNLQLHYDMGEGRKMFTSTVEMFKADKMGSTFFFIDMDYGSEESDLDDISLGYWEIARSFKISNSSSFEPRIEYNGGLGGYSINDTTYHYSINSAFLVGGQYTWNNADFSKVLTLQGNYKYIKDKEDASFQLTAVWGLHFFNRKLSLTGFADFWKEENTYIEEGATDYVFLTEPQIWYNAMDHFSVGGEVEMASNFGGHKGFKVCPTVAVKWIF
jgi:hypothetical protein